MSQVAVKDQLQVEQLASSYQLGTFQQESSVKLTGRMLYMGILLSIIGIALVLMLMSTIGVGAFGSDVGSAVILGLFGLSVIGAGVYCMIYPLFYRSWHIYVYSEGLAFVRGSKIDAFRWEHIQSMWQKNVRYGNIGTYYSHTITIQGVNGKKVVFTDRFANVERVGNLVADQVLRFQLPQALEAYKAGQVIGFGPLSVSLQGVSNSKETIPWSQVKGVQISNGVVAVKKEGKRLNWSIIRVADIPNFFVFLTLVRSIME